MCVFGGVGFSHHAREDCYQYHESPFVCTGGLRMIMPISKKSVPLIWYGGQGSVIGGRRCN